MPSPSLLQPLPGHFAPHRAAVAEALAARICHDLVSPVGALVNGAELLREIGAGDAQAEIAMIGQSAERAAAVLAFHRLAFGAAGAQSAPMARTALGGLVAGMLASNRIAVHRSGEAGPPLPRPLARAAALGALCARAALGMGGIVALAFEPEPLPLTLWAESADPARASLLVEALNRAGPAADPDPRQIEFVLLPDAVAAAGARTDLRIEADRLTLRFLPG